jgi:NTE family protein
MRSPGQWIHVPGHRAQIVVNFLEERWGVKGTLKDLARTPEWLVNTTCIETGKNWRFSQNFMGDWKAGHHYDPPFRIAEAAAASAAVPYVIGALKLPLPEDGWYEIDPSNEKPRARKARSFETIALWDGGAYENLGLEPLYKMDRGMIDCDYIIVSDASGPLAVGKRSLFPTLLKGDLAGPRVFDIASDQIRSLRSRMFVNALTNKKATGALVRMGNSVRDIDISACCDRPSSDYARFQADREASLALKHPTNLSSLTVDTFRRVARHGYEVADATLTAHCPPLAPESMVWNDG